MRSANFMNAGVRMRLRLCSEKSSGARSGRDRALREEENFKSTVLTSLMAEEVQLEQS
jgi:hypothetical protein